ncbi:N-6 DNA methylase [endosymbiont GvMRE of Glomus versiforme]|uniref:class I SAM-dependent DNA methyltransferase n=1 Tax=endosymbiont GvMRE of Glomus versiforme TaxID=2039283 RepID=UPI000ED149EB|nr:N-6 DNA methylase [endosymbiont GvMRE of Glomus versiforme]RHZ37656.1 Type I restriction enzyme, M subunit [endosymbiont GvMRE of Glomus versiforme]
MLKLTEEDIRLEIDKELKKKGWELTDNKKKEVFTESYSTKTFADYLLIPCGWIEPLVVIEVKKAGEDLDRALEQAKRDAKLRNASIAYAIIGKPSKKIIKTWHLAENKPLIFNGQEVDFILDKETALKFQKTNEYNPQEIITIESRKQLIQIFSFVNKQLRSAGLTEGDERFSEFCSILFLKILSEQEEKEAKYKRKQSKVIPLNLRWKTWQDQKNAEDLLRDVNRALNCGNHEEKKFCCFQKKYTKEIFQPLKIQNPTVLKRIVDKLTPLHLTGMKIDVKGEAFEYFLKEYTKNQKKDLGQYFTPRHIVDFLVRLVDPTINEKIYDPFCDTGGILIKVFNYIAESIPTKDREKWKKLKNSIIYGNEFTSIARVAKMNMILVGDGHNNIVKRDSLANPVPAKDKYDVVITNMPFSLDGPFDEYKDLYYLGRANGNSLCIEHCLDAAREDYGKRRIALITLEGVLHDRNYTKLRSYIYENWYVEYIIALPPFAFKPYANSNAAVLYLTTLEDREQRHVWYFKVKNDGFTENKREPKEGESDLDIFLKYKDRSEEEKLKMGFQKLDIEKIRNNNYASVPSSYKVFEFEESKHEMVSLGELIEKVKIPNEKNLPIWSLTKDRGFIPHEEKYKEPIHSKDTSNYKIVPPKHFAYRAPGVNEGYIGYNHRETNVCIPHYYPVFKVKNEKRIIPEYLFCVCQSAKFRE